MAEILDSVAPGLEVVTFKNNDQRVAAIGTTGNYEDAASVSRFVPNAVPRVITDGSPVNLFSVSLPASSIAGGSVLFLVEARDATNTQAMSGIATYSAVATSAGTVTGTITYVAANEAKTLSSGTLTVAFTASVSGSVCTFRIQPTGSLTETTYNIRYTLLPIVGEPTIL